MTAVLDSARNGESGLVDTWALPSVGPSGDDVLLVAFVALRTDRALTVPVGWTVRVNDNSITMDDGLLRYAMADRLVSSAAPPYSDSFTSSGTAHWIACQVAFRASSIVVTNVGVDSTEISPPGGTNPFATVAVTPTAGRVLIANASVMFDTGGTFGGFAWPDGWAVLESFPGGSNIGASETAYKVADGTETDVTVSALGTFVHSVVVMAAEYEVRTDSDGTEVPPYVAPSPGAAVVEIYAAEPGAYRWGIAHWGDPSIWSTAGWRDVTPESVDIEVLWGSQRPELGILSKPEPASWGIDFYDPSRILDPSNREGPYYGDLEPGLPVRVRHGERVIRQGVAESIGYQFSESFGDEDTAYFRVTDIISVLANAQVPSDVTLSDTLSARARDAIAAAGLTVTVLPDRPDGDPVLAPWVTGQERSAWEWIVDAAESVLHVPIITNLGYVGFRAWAEPLDRARRLASPNLVGLQSITAHNGLYSVVTALQSPGDGGAVITRELTPKPRYGARRYDRDEVTPNAGDWAMAVLTDRAQAGLRWVPGEIYPLTAGDVDYFGSLEQLERVGLYYPEAAPAVVQDIVIVGGRIAITAKKDSEAIWSFGLQAAQTAQSPLIDDDTGTTFLVRDDDPTRFLYPDG